MSAGAPFDTASALRAIIEARRAFASAMPDLDRAARRAFETAVRAPDYDLSAHRTVCEALGPAQALAAMASLSPAARRAALRRLDPHAAETDAAARLAALGAGAAPLPTPTPLHRSLSRRERTPDGLGALRARIGPDAFAAALRATPADAVRRLTAAVDPEAARLAPAAMREALRTLAERSTPQPASPTEARAHERWFKRLERIHGS